MRLLHDLPAPAESLETPIAIASFIDFSLDIVGWYAVGHHQPQPFLSAIAQQDSQALFVAEQVEWTWAKLLGKYFVVTGEPGDGSQPITLVEDSI